MIHSPSSTPVESDCVWRPGVHDGSESVLLAELCDEFSQRVQLGERPGVDEYMARFPQLADQIAIAFPALMLFECPDAPESAVVCPDTEAVPEFVANYRIVRRVGRGGMGIVYEAVHPTVSRRVALKQLNARGRNSQMLRDRFLREAEASSRLNHPNIVPFLDCGKDGETAYLAMHFIDGQSLDHLLETHWRTSAEMDISTRAPAAVPSSNTTMAVDGSFIATDFLRIAKLGADVASALDHAHRQDTIHRDVKPANLILDGSGKIWVMDFGLAKLCDDDSDLSHIGTLIGTPRYMAPEQLRGQADERSDVYALGVTLYELASGQRAWEQTDGDVQSAFHLPEIRSLSPDIPSELAKIIMKACSHVPSDRYQSAAELQHVLNQFAHGRSVSDRRMKSSAGIPAGRSRRLSGLVKLAAIALAGILLLPGDSRSAHVVAPVNDSLSPEKKATSVTTVEDHFDLRDGSRLEHTVLPTMHRHTGLILWWVTGGDDAELFEIDRSCGRLKFRRDISFAEPQDADRDNRYEVTIGMRSPSAMEHADVIVALKP